MICDDVIKHRNIVYHTVLNRIKEISGKVISTRGSRLLKYCIEYFTFAKSSLKSGCRLHL